MHLLSNGSLPQSLIISNSVPRDDALLGIVAVTHCDVRSEPDDLERLIAQLVNRRAGDLDAHNEHRRLTVRDLLRNGSYKPTGRGKPASEYLLRTAREGNFPRINGPVDCCNYISLNYMLPISLWDLARTGGKSFNFRLGTEDESYIFNQAGQSISLKDLITGFVVEPGSASERPIVNPIKDSVGAKTNKISSALVGCIYAPMEAVSIEQLEDVSAHMARLLQQCGGDATTATAAIPASQSATLSNMVPTA